MDASSHHTCLPGTRTVVLTFLTDWLATPSKGQSIFWLHSPAGSGKSAISDTIADYFRSLGRLGAFLFFCRDDRFHSDPAAVIRTLAYQLAASDPYIQSAVCAEIEKDHSIAQAPILRQFTKLLLEPLNSIGKLASEGPIIIVIDALDECGDPASWKSLLALLAREVAKLPAVFRFLITSRAESDIVASFLGQSNVINHELGVGTDDDIYLFLRAEISDIRNHHSHLAPDWPGETSVNLLAVHSDGLFIWASVAMKMLMDAYDPDEQLRVLLEAGSHGSRAAGAALDVLYEKALNSVGLWDSHGFSTDFRAIMGVVLAGRIPLSDNTIDHLLGLDGPKQSRAMLSRLQSLLIWSPGKTIQVLHMSFGTYLTDPIRSGQQPWFIDLSVVNEILAVGCLRLMRHGLRFDICNLESSHLRNEDIADLTQRIEAAIPSHLAYACQFWADHLQAAPGVATLANDLHHFIHDFLLYWLEVLSLLGNVPFALPALQKTAQWSRVSQVLIHSRFYVNILLQDHDEGTAALAADAIAFVSSFLQAISQSAPHIYISALPFAPTSSLIARQYLPQFPNVLSVIVGRAAVWTAVADQLDKPKGTFFSVAWENDCLWISRWGCADLGYQYWNPSVRANHRTPSHCLFGGLLSKWQADCFWIRRPNGQSVRCRGDWGQFGTTQRPYKMGFFNKVFSRRLAYCLWLTG